MPKNEGWGAYEKLVLYQLRENKKDNEEIKRILHQLMHRDRLRAAIVSALTSGVLFFLGKAF